MIGKIIKGKTFGGCVRYVLGKLGAEIVDTNIFADTVNEFASELALTQKLRPQVSNVVCHMCLSLSPTECLDNESWEKLLEKYLKEMGFTNTLYLAVKHIDNASHEHIHIVASRIRLDSSIVSDSWDFTRSQAAIRKLEKEFELVEVKSSWESDRSQKTKNQLLKEAVTGLPPVKQYLTDKISSVLEDAISITELIERLNRDRIEVKISYDRAGKPKGISFRMDNVSIAGSQVGTAYSLPRIIKKLENNLSQSQQVNDPETTNQNTEPKIVTIDRILNTIREKATADVTIPELIDRLKQSGVDAYVKFTRTEKIKGISYSLGNESIRGNELGKEYSWGGLQKYLKVDYDPARDNPIILMMQRGSEKDSIKSLEIPQPKISAVNKVPESLLVELALELEKLRSLPLADLIVPEPMDIKVKLIQADTTVSSYMVAAICELLLDELGTNRFGEIGKNTYRIYRDEDSLTVERLRGDREIILQVKGDQVEIDNLKEQDIKQFEEAWQLRQENKERVKITKQNEGNLSR